MRNIAVSYLLLSTRRRMGKSQKEIALALNISPGYYSRLEGSGLIPSHQLSEIARILCLSKDDLFQKLNPRGIEEKNLMPLIRCLSMTAFEKLNMREFEFLAKMQQVVGREISPKILVDLMHRKP